MDALIERDSGNTCPTCGKPLRECVITLGRQEIVRVMQCECEKQAADVARREAAQKGRAKMREDMRREYGLKARQQGQTFANFYPEDGQKEAYNAARTFAEQGPAERGQGLLFVGGVGSGKSHLAAAIINAMVDAAEIPDDNAISGFAPYGNGPVFVSAVELLERIRRSYSVGNTDKIIDSYAEAKLLVIDDIGAEKATEWTMERIFEIVDHRYNQYLPMVITSNLRPVELKAQLGDRVYDRIRAMCKLIAVTVKSQRTTAGT